MGAPRAEDQKQRAADNKTQKIKERGGSSCALAMAALTDSQTDSDDVASFGGVWTADGKQEWRANFR